MRPADSSRASRDDDRTFLRLWFQGLASLVDLSQLLELNHYHELFVNCLFGAEVR